MEYKGLERRRHLRVRANFVVTYKPLEGNEAANLSQTKNFSQGGILLTTNRPFGRGTILKMSIKIPLAAYNLDIIGKVLESREITKNLIYETRIVFEELDYKTAQLFGQTVDRYKQKGR